MKKALYFTFLMQVHPFNHLIKPNFEFFPNYRHQLHGEQLSILHSQLLTRLLYYMSPNMVYTRIIGSRQIGNYLAGHVPPNRKLFGGTCPAK